MRVKAGRLDGIKLIEPELFGDERGFFMETYNRREFLAHGIDLDFVQDNHSRSVKNTLRGLHFQINPGQDKLVRVLRGEVFDVIVDLRSGSPSFGEWEGYRLSAENHLILLVPVGFAHGFFVLSDAADFAYKCSAYYSPEEERGLAWDDPDLAIDWPLTGAPILSERDKKNPRLKDLPAYFRRDFRGNGKPCCR